MLNFRNTNILFFILLVLLISANYFIGIPLFAYALLVIAYLGILAYGSYKVSLNFYMPVLCSAKTRDKEIAISFDDGPDAEITPAILTILNRANVHAAFFLIGNRIPDREILVRKLYEEGHLIGNHSFSHHALFDFFSSRKMGEDLKSMDQLIINMLGIRPRLFRPPYGVTNPNLKSAVQAGGYKSIGWSIRSLDTVIK
ncbi:MAG: polysaccharide deacetylase family protein, partial [Chitinophagales bacterium]